MRSTQCYQAFRTTALAALRLLAVLIVLSASARLASAVVRNSYGTRAVKFDFDLIIAGAVPVVFFFQAEDGIRDDLVTGVQRVLFRSWGTCRSNAALKPCRAAKRSASGSRRK